MSTPARLLAQDSSYGWQTSSAAMVTPCPEDSTPGTLQGDLDLELGSKWASHFTSPTTMDMTLAPTPQWAQSQPPHQI